MSLIKEPDGVDFIIESPPLTDEERIEISDFIQTRKQESKLLAKQTKSKKTRKINA